MNIILSIFESIYLWYMFTQFKTTTYFNHPLDFLTSSIPFMNHGPSTSYSSKICPLGVLVGYLAPLWFLGRHVIHDQQKLKTINTYLILTLFIASLLTNMNAFIYSIPIFIIEYYNYISHEYK